MCNGSGKFGVGVEFPLSNGTRRSSLLASCAETDKVPLVAMIAQEVGGRWCGMQPSVGECGQSGDCEGPLSLHAQMTSCMPICEQSPAGRNTETVRTFKLQ